MRALLRLFAVVVVLAVIAGGAFAYFHVRSGGGPVVAHASPCPDANELAGIEGYAPGAGGAAKQGNEVGSLGGGLGGGLAGGGDATPSPAPRAPGDCPPGPTRDPLIANLDALAAALPAEQIDIAARAKTLPDGDAAFAFVRDAIGLENYTGALRGARGTLIAGAGNADDKALLLAALLQAHGETVRFARSTLTGADVASLGSASATVPSPRPIPTTNPQLLRALNITDADVKSAVATTARTTAGALDEALKLAATRAGDLTSELSRGGVTLGGTPAAPFDRVHYYVQVQRQGTWTDADPMPGVAFGRHLGAADGFVAGAIPADRFPTVTFTVRVAHADGTRSDVIAQTRSSADLAGVPIHVFVSPDGSNALAKSSGSTSFTPAVRIGGDAHSGDAIDLSASGGTAVTAVDLAIAVTSAAGTKRWTRRFFERAPGESDDVAAAKLANAYDIVVAPGPMNEAFELAQTIASLRVALAPQDGVDPMPLPVVQLLHLDGVFGRAWAKAVVAPMRFSYDRPVIVMVHRGFVPLPRPHPVADIDIVDNGERATAFDPVVAANANVVRGYMDTVIEQHVLDGIDVGAPQVFAAARTAGASNRTLAAGAAVPSDITGMAHEQLAATLSSGNAAIVTGRAVDVAGGTHLAWWSIDPASGNTVGRLETGGGQGMTEYNKLQAEVARRGGPLVEFYGDFWRCIAWGVEAPLEGEGAATEVSFLTCIANAYCHLLQSIVNDHIPEDAAENAMEAATIREALQIVIKQRAEAYAKAQIEARTGSLDAKKRLDDAMGKLCDAGFSSPFH